jgi:hypothetical protein
MADFFQSVLSSLLGASGAPETVFSSLRPANNAGVLGFSRITLDGQMLSVDVVASGLTPNQPHIIGIYGFPNDRSGREAEARDDLDGDGLVETAEGIQQAYGPAIAFLTEAGPGSSYLGAASVQPVADAQGFLSFSETYRLDPADPEDAVVLERLGARLDHRVIQIHGLELPAASNASSPEGVGGAGVYLPELPVAAGNLRDLSGNLGTALDLLAQATPGALSAAATEFLKLHLPYSLNLAGTGPAAPEPASVLDAPQTDSFVALLQPANNSGANGSASVLFNEANGTLTIDMAITGLTPGASHPVHLHGFADDRPSLLPNYRLDSDRDGFVENAEGAGAVGPVILAITADGTVTSKAEADFPTADGAGRLLFHRTYQFDSNDPEQRAIFSELRDRVSGRELQIQGLEVASNQGEGTGGEVDGTAGFKAALPVANGILLPVPEQIADPLLAVLRNVMQDIIFG